MLRNNGFCILLLFVLILTPFNKAFAEDNEKESFKSIVKESKNIVFASVVGMQGKKTIHASINKAFKGKIAGQIRISSFNNCPNLHGMRPAQFFQKGHDYFFFLGHTMISTVPFKPVPGSLVLPVEKGKVDLSIISPKKFKQYKHEMEYKFFVTYLENLVAKIDGRATDPVFQGELVELLEKETAKGANGKMAATYLQMLLDLQGTYNNPNLLFKLLEQGDINAKALAMDTLLFQTLLEPELTNKDIKKLKKKSKKRKGKKSKKNSEDNKISLRMELPPKLFKLLKSDASRLIQSKAAMAISNLQDRRGLETLETLIESKDMEAVEACEVYPNQDSEPPKKAIVRAIVEFEGDDALDILERELLKNNVDTFKLILDVFKDYSDSGLYLLLLDLLQDANFLPRQVAILEYFRSAKDEETIQELQKLFVSPDAASEFVRKSIIEVMQDFNEPKQTVGFIIKNGLHDPTPVVRQASAKALGTMNAKDAVPAFKDNYFKESNRLAREFYVEALAKIKSRSAYDLLRFLKEKETDKRMLKQIEFALKKSKYLSL